MKTAIDILCATDNKYAPYCGVMLTSLFENNRNCSFDVYLFVSGDFLETNTRKFIELGNRFGNKIILKEINNPSIESFPINGQHITIPTYFRLLAAEMLPSTVQKVIYLDSDLLVVGGITPLWTVDLSDKALACITNCPTKNSSHGERLGYPESFGYFNAGVLIINVQYWRENGVGQKLMDYVESHGSSLRFMDQDVMNGVLYGEKEPLPEKYNFQVSFFWTSRWNDFSEEYRNSVLEECENARIVHFVGPEKPWNRNYGGPFFTIWHNYRRKSLWRNETSIKPFSKYVKHILERRYFSGLFKRQHPKWAILPETQEFYR